MSVEQVNKIKKIQKTNLTGSKTIGISGSYDGLKNMSVFDYAKKHPQATQSVASNDDNTNISKGNKSKTDADGKTKNASGWIKEIKHLSPNLAGQNRTTGNFGNTSLQKARGLMTIMGNNANTINRLSTENDEITTELDSLTAQREVLSADDGTGSGANSAYSLNIGEIDSSNPFKNNGEKNSDTEINDINSRIEILTGKQASITKTITTKTSSYKRNSSSLSNLKAQALSKAKAAKAAAAEAAKKAETAQKIGTVTTVIGAATTALGALLAAGVFTSPSSPPVVASGAVATTTGTTAVSTAGNLLGITANLGTTAGKVQAIGSAISSFNTVYSKLNTKTTTTKTTTKKA